MDLKQFLASSNHNHFSSHAAFYSLLITVPVIAFNYILFFGEESKLFRNINLHVRTSVGLVMDKVSSTYLSFTQLLSPLIPFSFLLPSSYPPSASNGNYINLKSIASRLRDIELISSSASLSIHNATGKVESGYTFSTNRVTFDVDNDPNKNNVTLIVKTTSGYDARLASLAGGRCREAIIYDNPPKRFPKEILPQTISASYNSFFGTYTVVAQDVQSLSLKEGIRIVSVPHAFGNQAFGSNEESVKILHDFFGSQEVCEYEVLKVLVSSAADMHATFWNDKSLLQDYPYLKAYGWVHGKGRASWEENLRKLKYENWPKAIETMGEDLDERMIKLVNGYLDRSNWDSFQNYLKKEMEKGFTLSHGDYHANNMMLVMDGSNPNTPSTYLKLFDWSEVGIGFGEFDIAQMMISDVKPEIRRKHERSLMENVYYPKIKAKDSSYTFDECWKRYGVGSIERWIFFFLILASMPVIPKSLNLYFQQQMLEFIIDHAGFDYPYQISSNAILP